MLTEILARTKICYFSHLLTHVPAFLIQQQLFHVYLRSLYTCSKRTILACYLHQSLGSFTRVKICGIISEQDLPYLLNKHWQVVYIQQKQYWGFDINGIAGLSNSYLKRKCFQCLTYACLSSISNVIDKNAAFV